jgi:hypothetical protein
MLVFYRYFLKLKSFACFRFFMWLPLCRNIVICYFPAQALISCQPAGLPIKPSKPKKKLLLALYNKTCLKKQTAHKNQM